jgi:hypothetical protein
MFEMTSGEMILVALITLLVVLGTALRKKS